MNDVWCAGCGRRIEAGEVARKWLMLSQAAPRGSEDMRPMRWRFCGMACLVAWANALSPETHVANQVMGECIMSAWW